MSEIASKKISEVVTELVSFDRTERPVYVKLFFRDENGDVISKKAFPVKAVFSHGENAAYIYIEQSHADRRINKLDGRKK